MTVNTPLTQKNDIKIFILYLLANIGFPVTFAEMVDAATSDDIVRYFDFAPAFNDLLDAGHIIINKVNDVEYFTISAEAKKYAADLESGIAREIREKSLFSAIRHINFSRRGVVLENSVIKTDDDKYMITCRILERGEMIYETKVKVDTEAQIQKMVANFKNRPEIIFRGTLSLISGDINYIFDSK